METLSLLLSKPLYLDSERYSHYFFYGKIIKKFKFKEKFFRDNFKESFAIKSDIWATILSLDDKVFFSIFNSLNKTGLGFFWE